MQLMLVSSYKIIVLHIHVFRHFSKQEMMQWSTQPISFFPFLLDCQHCNSISTKEIIILFYS